ncbi:hypothetical protein MN116_004327 [Schistosoma mekongi]|uniref:FAM194 C-terminal domain-containing protein n=1 Tax=Schistosoma mekongi TaxID=38744 RepID=A0AAE1ZGV3_SCHME|nr:hypothetical protein MN116_004327 [Schistosoma mekongi]
METDHYSLMCYDGVERIFKCQHTQTLREDIEMQSEVDLDIDVVREGTEDLDILDDGCIESREAGESLNSDNIRKSVTFRKTPTEITAPAKYVDDEYGMESEPESSDREEYPTREEYINSEWLNKPISNWINYAYVNIPNMLDKVDNLKNVKYEPDLCNKFDFPYVLQVVKDVCCRNKLEKFKLSSLAQTYAKRIAIADGSKNCKFCGRILQSSSSSSLTKSLHASNEEYCCDQYHRLFRFAVNYSELLYKRYRQQQQQQRSYNKMKLTELKKYSLKNQFNESSTNIQEVESGLLKTVENNNNVDTEMADHKETSDSLTDTTGNVSLDNEESECTDKILYQLSNHKYIEQGWTTINHTQYNNDNNDLLMLTEESKSMHVNVDEVTKQSIEIQLDFTQHFYSNGEVFLLKYSDNTGVIFYPTGNPAILFLPNESNDLLFVIHDILHLNITNLKSNLKVNRKQKDITSSKVINNKSMLNNKKIQSTVGQLIGIFNTNIHGVVYDNKNNIKLQYNPDEGVHFKEPMNKYTKICKWKWSGEKHVHAPPFQSLLIKLNDMITLKLYQRNKIYLHFQTMKINCKLDLTSKQLKLQWIDTEQYK